MPHNFLGNIFELLLPKEGDQVSKSKGFLEFNLPDIWVVKDHYWKTG
jgi:hypothetical protein